MADWGDEVFWLWQGARFRAVVGHVVLEAQVGGPIAHTGLALQNVFLVTLLNSLNVPQIKPTDCASRISHAVEKAP